MAAETRSAGRVVRQDLVDGVLFGVLAYVGGYVLTYVFVTVDGVRFSGEAGRMTVAGWVFYAAHNVRIQVTGLAGRRTDTVTVDLFKGFGELVGLNQTVPELLYLSIPIIMLVGAGYLTRQRIAEPGLETSTVAVLGTSIIVGYLPLVAFGRFFFTHSENRVIVGREVVVTVEPVLSMALILAGIVYPIVFGAIGATLAQRTLTSPTTPRD